MLSRVAPWLTSARPAGPAAGAVDAAGGSIRPLTAEDTAALWSLVRPDPVANVFMAAHLEAAGTAGPTASGARILGCFDDGALVAACWAGINVVPVGLDAVRGAQMGAYLAAANRHVSSIFGPAEGVLGIWSTLQHSSADPFDVRPDQPLMELRGTPAVEPDPSLRFSTPEDLDALVPACVAMFEEEVGYSPLAGGGQHYRHRVKSLIEHGHSVLYRDAEGEVVFKAELGNVSADAVQIQGVWMNPAHRGQGRAAAYMAAVVELSRRFAPVASLYVNDYNHRAMAAYRRVGFEQVGTFATILF
ncbi:GNAT family N-acetyltransferase [Arthrobacter sp. I2-34]|uniref:GNAT family N-acetyltransferase n=2 Tax=Arthrobacter hankyongi TaxID=2904801 RepID=A0ABS9L130_9MICC|nr:GNAT family N-acetyltransferase [Arthrobacter hankyongi]